MSSEHPLAKSIVKHMSSLLTENESEVKVINFKNINGEGIVAKLQLSESTYEVMCGNEKLMKRYDINLNYNRLDENIQELESLGRTVVIVTIDKVARLLISLEEEHLAKEEAKAVINYLQKDLGLKVAMITGDNHHTAQRVADHLGIP